MVLKANPHPTLAKLSAYVAAVLEQKYGIKQAFPFSIHLTLGRICDANDQPISQEFKAALTKQNAQESAPIIVKEFKLKGHDGSQDAFPLSGAK